MAIIIIFLIWLSRIKIITQMIQDIKNNWQKVEKPTFIFLEMQAKLLFFGGIRI